MKECIYCKEEIKKDAKICPHCRKKQYKSKYVNFIIIGIAVLAIIGIVIAVKNDAGNLNNELDKITNNAKKGYGN